jgi:hypothetical protein
MQWEVTPRGGLHGLQKGQRGGGGRFEQALQCQNEWWEVMGMTTGSK